MSPLLYVHSSLSKAFLSSPHITLLVSSPFCFYVTTPERSGENRSYMLRSLKCLLLDLLQQRFASIHDVGRGALYSPGQSGYDSGTLFGTGNRRQNQKSLLVWNLIDR